MCMWVCVCVCVCVCVHSRVCVCVCFTDTKRFALGMMKPAGMDEPQTHSCTQLKRTLHLNSHQLQLSDVNNPEARANAHMRQNTYPAMQTSVCVHFIMCVSAEEWDEAAVGAKTPLFLATYCLQSQACILYSKLGREKPCGKCALKNTKSYTLPHTEPDRLGIDNIPFCFSIYSGKIWPLTSSISNSEKEAARECHAWGLAKWEKDRSIPIIHAFLLPSFQQREAAII